MKFNKIEQNKILSLNEEIERMFPKHLFTSSDLDYSVINTHIKEWDIISKVGQCAVFVFDCSTHKFVYVSELGLETFGLSKDDFLDKGHEPAFSLMHPEDISLLILTRRKVYSLLQSFPTSEVMSYKLVHEFRLRNLAGKYMRITEQEQVIRLDEQDNIWLTFSIFNIDAGNKDEAVKSLIYNCHTGEQIFIDLSDTLEETLTARETEILKLIRKGLLAKEISGRLGIRINTVNVHRQNIFNKLQVDNAIEAVNKALTLGLLN